MFHIIGANEIRETKKQITDEISVENGINITWIYVFNSKDSLYLLIMFLFLFCLNVYNLFNFSLLWNYLGKFCGGDQWIYENKTGILIAMSRKKMTNIKQ